MRKRMLALLLICVSILAIRGEEAATETTTVDWNQAPKLFSDNIKVGKFAVRSGEINGNYPSFVLNFHPKDMRADNASISCFLRVNTNASAWLPEVRLVDKTNGGFLHWRPNMPLHKGNMDWQKIDLKISAMKQYKKVDLKKISQIVFIGYRVIEPKGQVYRSEFFIDGLAIKNSWSEKIKMNAQRPFAFKRMSGTKKIVVNLTNNTSKNLTAGKVLVTAGGQKKSHDIVELSSGKSTTITFDFDSSLRPGKYRCQIEIADQSGKVLDSGIVKLYIAPRPVPNKMPVIMWGHGDLHKVQKCGFTHSFVTLLNSKKVFAEKKITEADYLKDYQKTAKLLDQALIDGFGAVAFMGIGRLINAQNQFLRVGRKGKVLQGHKNICASFPEVKKFCYDAGASTAKTYGKFSAFDFALVETENRDGTKLCFHKHDKENYKKYSGKDIPSEVKSKMGIHYTKIADFPADHIIKDDNPVLQYLKWFWQQGDGWNQLYTEIHRGLQSGKQHIGTWYDPAVRVPSVSGSGGEVDYASQWTYTYPDPIKIGKVVDELFAMTSLSPRKEQKVMNTTQIIWYRSATAPKRKPGEHPNIPLTDWEKRAPDANYITIAPDHLSEAFWSEISRPISGIMYHGWWSFGDYHQDNRWKYRYTNSETPRVLKRLVDTVVTPLGPSLKQIPDISSDIAFLQSFTSEMFAQVGEFGWGWGWGNDAYQILRYAHLQPKVVYEESILRGGLKGVKILVAVKCPVLTESVARKIIQFQQLGGIIIGDENLAPGITPDIIMSSYNRTGPPHIDKSKLQAKAKKLRSELKGAYFPYADTSNPDVILRVRRYKDCDYLFVINDKRTYGNYVGQYKRLMENGLATQANITLKRKGYVYDLVSHQSADSKILNRKLNLQVKLAPGEGKLFMICKYPIANLKLTVAPEVKRNSQMPIIVEISDTKNRVIHGIVPILVNITDSKGEKAEFSGYYGVKDGKLRITLDIAKNDDIGTWEITVTELASGKISTKSFIVK